MNEFDYTQYKSKSEPKATANSGFFIAQNQKWNLKQQFLAEVQKRGGWANCHAHIDKGFYITREGLDQAMLSMEEKWRMSDTIKRSDTQTNVENRLRTALEMNIAQGVTVISTFIDAYDAVGHKAIDAANVVKEEYKDRIKLITISQPLGGLNDPKALKLYEEITAKADIAGGLPSYDRPYMQKNLDNMFAIAKNLNKPIHVHIDQENNPHERDTELLAYNVAKHGYYGRTVAVHAISLSAQPRQYRLEMYKKMRDVGMPVVVSPSAAINMKQLEEYQSHIHNSIANVPEMIEAGLTVGLGVDNVCDFYNPFGDNDMWFEARLMMDACRYYDFDKMVDVCSTNGRKILSIT